MVIMDIIMMNTHQLWLPGPLETKLAGESLT